MEQMEDISYYKVGQLGKGTPYAIVTSPSLVKSPDLLVPSLRDFHVIFWFKRGTGKYYIDFKPYEFKPNTLVLVPRDQIHYFASLDAEYHDIQSITFHPEYIYKTDSDLAHLFSFTIASHIDGVQILHLRKEDADYLDMLSRHMLQVYQEWDAKSRDAAFYHWLCLFLIYCGRLQTPHDEGPMDERAKQLLQFSELLEANFRLEYKVEYYLAHMGLTVKALSRLTKERYKLSPKAVIDQRRVLELKRQLKGTTMPIKNIAYNLGFDEPTNMVKYFKKHTGLTPNAFRDAQL